MSKPPTESLSLSCLYIKTTAPRPPHQPRNRLPSYQRKQAETLASNIKAMIDIVGIERVGLLTLTFPKKTSREEAQRKWRSLWTHEFSKRFGEVIKVFERHKDGSVHYHLIIELSHDIRTGFDWEAFQKSQDIFRHSGRTPEFARQRQAYLSSASPALKAEWKYFRKVLKAYGFGRHELLPIRLSAVAVGRYVGKYLSQSRRADTADIDKGVRKVEYLHGSRRQSSRWSWNSPSGWVWRKKLGEWASQQGFKTFEEIAAKHGKRWGWKKYDEIMSTELPDGTVYPSQRHREMAKVEQSSESLEMVRRLRSRMRGGDKNEREKAMNKGIRGGQDDG